jgi:Zn-dependent protease
MGIGGLSNDIVYKPKAAFLSSDFPMTLLRAEYWLSIVLTSVALINMLPMFPFDGDKFLDTALSMFGFKRSKEIRMVANGAAYAILALNVGLSLLRFGFLRY